MVTIPSLLAYRNNVWYVKYDLKNNNILGFHTLCNNIIQNHSKILFFWPFWCNCINSKGHMVKNSIRTFDKIFRQEKWQQSTFFLTRLYIHSIYSSQKMRQRCFLPEMGLARASGQIVVTSGLYKKMAMHWFKRTYLV